MYKIHTKPKSKWRRVILWLLIIIGILLLLVLIGYWIYNQLRPKSTIHQAAAINTKVVYTNQTKHYDEEDFGIDLPSSWQAVPRPIGPYQSYTWQSSDRVTDGQEIQVLENVIPANFAVNRVLIVEGEGDHLTLAGTASDNCSNFTKGLIGKSNQVGVPAKWQNIDFLCDQGNTQRDVIGTSSTDGVNTVILKNQSTGVSHKFFFIYSDHSINPDYTIFYNALLSLRMH